MSNNVDNYNRQTGGSNNEMVLNGAVSSNKVVLQVTETVTLAELNAGKTILPGVTGRTIKPHGFTAVVNGTFLTGTSIELEDTNASPVVVFSTVTAGLGDGDVLYPGDTSTTIGAGFQGALTSGAGLAVTKTGSDFTGGTDITFTVQYTLV